MRIRYLLPGLLLGYLLILALFFVFQRGLLYHPDPRLDAPGDHDLAMAEVSILTEDSIRLAAWYAPSPGPRPTIVFFGGNGGRIGHHAGLFQALLDTGYGLLAVNYRGFGGSEGRPTQQGLHRDGRAALAYLREKGVPEHRLVLYGQSLGSAVASRLALEAQARAVVLESPFTSLEARARELFWFLPVGYMLRDRYDNRPQVQAMEEPVLILHGEADWVVPISHGRALYRLAREPKAFVAYEGRGHDDLDPEQVVQDLEAFLRDVR